MKIKIFLSFFLILSGCAPSSAQDCQREAKGTLKSLISDLQKVHSKEELIEHETSIKNQMNKLVRLMVRAKKLQGKESDSHHEEDRELSDLLLEEIKRIYQIEGVREVMEIFQRQALLELDAFDQLHSKN